jgi:hypothetical protein
MVPVVTRNQWSLILNLNQSKTAIVAELRKEFGATVRSSVLWNADVAAFKWASKNLKKVGRGLFDLGGPELAKVKPVDMSKLIRERFGVLELLADGVIAKNIRSLIVAGAPGVGKTFTLEQKLNAARKDGKVNNVVAIRGSVSPIGLFVALWENAAAGNVIILDDVDSIFGDEEAMNILKAALDTSPVRTISWLKDSSYLKDREIDNSFEYEGQIVFITNTDPDAVIAKNAKMSPHMNALLSRSVFLDLAIHDNKAIMVRIEQVLGESNMLTDLGMTEAQGADIMGWMRANVDGLRSLSLRTVIACANFIKTNPDWQMLARATLLKARY